MANLPRFIHLYRLKCFLHFVLERLVIEMDFIHFDRALQNIFQNILEKGHRNQELTLLHLIGNQFFRISGQPPILVIFLHCDQVRKFLLGRNLQMICKVVFPTVELFLCHRQKPPNDFLGNQLLLYHLNSNVSNFRRLFSKIMLTAK